MDSIEHDPKVPYAKADLGRLDGFNRRRVVKEDTEPTFIASGACPECHAPGQQGFGYLRSGFAGIAPWVEVMMKCECGFSHGEKDGAAGCGRTWTVGGLAGDWTLNNE